MLVDVPKENKTLKFQNFGVNIIRYYWTFRIPHDLTRYWLLMLLLYYYAWHTHKKQHDQFGVHLSVVVQSLTLYRVPVLLLLYVVTHRSWIVGSFRRFILGRVGRGGRENQLHFRSRVLEPWSLRGHGALFRGLGLCHDQETNN